ncbi:MAG: periplasmic heavy metal sensor [Bacteroidetes bacterium]|nr:periplasmic heavy metal sensor [Bacteroidota bacterium]MCW5896263.1 periplasmic heavy metal sensor [Bacteroidota bacterium]
MKRLLLFGTFLVIFAVTSTVAQPGRGPRAGAGIGQRHDAVLAKLDLTEAQQTQMEKLRIDMMKKQTELRSKIQSLRLDIKSAFLADKVDRNTIEKNIKAITAAQDQQKMNMLDHWFAVNNILTAEQQKIWKRHAATMGQHMGGRDGQKQARGFFRERMRGNWDND